MLTRFFLCVQHVCARLFKAVHFWVQIHVIEGREDRLSGRSDKAALPAVTITSYEMMKRLSCEACHSGQGQDNHQQRNKRVGGKEVPRCSGAHAETHMGGCCFH